MSVDYLGDEHMCDFEWIGALPGTGAHPGPPRHRLARPTAAPLWPLVGGIVCASVFLLLLRRRRRAR